MKSTIGNVLLGAATAALFALSFPPAAATAQPVILAQAGACHVSLFGTVAQVAGANEFTLAGTRVGHIHVRDRGAQFNTHGLVLRPGVYAGVYGCFGPAQRYFNAEQVTLATSAAAYEGYSAAPSGARGPCRVSLFGNVTQVFANDSFALQTLRTRLGTIRIWDKGMSLRSNGLALQPGVFAGVYGCFVNNGQSFAAEEVTLATSAQTYGAGSGYRRPIVTVQGTIDEVGAGYIGVETRYDGHIHVYTSQTGFRRGQHVSVRGSFNPVQSSMNAATIAVTP